MPVLKKAASANAAEPGFTNWTNPQNAFHTDVDYNAGVFASGTHPVKGNYFIPNVSSAEVPDGSVINAVVARIFFTSANITTFLDGAQKNVGGASPVSFGTVTLAQLRAAATSLRMLAASTGSGPKLNACWVEIDYTPPSDYTALPIPDWDKSNDPAAQFGTTAQQVHDYYVLATSDDSSAAWMLMERAYDCYQKNLHAKARLFFQAATLFGPFASQSYLYPEFLARYGLPS